MPTIEIKQLKIQEDQMAKGQARTNREAPKPKKDKTAAPVTGVPGAQVKVRGHRTQPSQEAEIALFEQRRRRCVRLLPI